MGQLRRLEQIRRNGNARATWGEVDGTLTNQSDLVAALAGASALNDYVIIQSKSDFPAPAAGIIQLADNCIYQVNGTIILGADRLVLGSGTVVMGVQSSHDILVYTGTAACIQALGGNNLRINDMTISAAAGAMVDAVDASVVNLMDIIGVAERFGRFEDCDTVVIQQSAGVQLESGIELVNSSPGALFAILNARLTQKASGAGILLDLGTSVWDSYQQTEIEMNSDAAGTDISGAAANANLTPTTGRGRVLNSIVNGDGAHLTGISVDDAQWRFVNNTGVPDSVDVSSMQMTGNSDVTDIVTQNVFVKVAGTTTLPTAKRFDGGDPVISNNVRYLGLSPITVTVTVNAELVKSGSSKDYQIQVFKNGSPIGVPSDIEVGNKESPRVLGVVTSCDEDDEFDFRVANTVDTDDVTVTVFTMSVIGI
jgi:hypothetical protein